MKNLFFVLSVVFMVVGCSGEVSTYEESYKSALKYYENEEYQSAIIEAKNAIQKERNKAEPRLLLARIYLDVKNGQAAEKELGVAARNGADKKQVNLLLMKAYLESGKYTEVLEVPENEVPQEKKSRSLYHVYRSLAYASTGKFDDATTELKYASKYHDSYYDYELARTKIMLASGRVSQAKSILRGSVLASSRVPEVELLRAKIYVHENKINKAITILEKILSRTRPTAYETPILFSIYILLSDLYIQKEKYIEAGKIIEQVKGKHPKSFFPYYQQGLIYYRQKKYEQAKEYLQEALTKNSEHPQTLLLLGSVNYALGFYNQAVSYLRKFLTINPSSIEARKLLAASQLKLQEPEEALKNFSYVAELSPNDEHILKVMGDISLALGKTELGRRYLKKAAGQGADKIKVDISLAQSYFLEGQYGKVVEVLSGIGWDEMPIQGKKLLFMAHIKSGLLDKAKYIASKLVESEPDNPDAYLLIGTYYMLADDKAKAAMQFEHALKIEPDYVPALLNIAKLKIKDAQYSKAQDYIHRVLNLDSGNTQALMLLATIYDKTGKSKDYIATLEKVIGINNKILLPHVALSRYYLSIGDNIQALKVAVRAVKVFPESKPALANLIEAQLANKSYQEAKSTAQKMFRLYPKSIGSLVVLGRIEAMQGNYDQSRYYLEQALEVSKDNISALALLSRIELLSGNSKKAFEIAEKIKTKHTNSPIGYIVLADLFVLQRNYDRAETEYVHALKKTKKSSIFNKYIDILLLNNKEEAAFLMIEDWLKTYPDDYSIRMKYAILLQERDLCDKAIPHYLRLERRSSENVVVLNNLSLCFLAIDKNEALKYADKAIGIARSNPAVNDTYGWILINTGDAQKGLRFIDTALSSEPSNEEYKYHKAVALLKLKRSEEAKILLQDIIRSHTSSRYVELAKSMLNNL